MGMMVETLCQVTVEGHSCMSGVTDEAVVTIETGVTAVMVETNSCDALGQFL